MKRPWWWKRRSSRRGRGGEGRERGKEWLRESKRSEKHETRISLSITYALNPGIYASGINARRSALRSIHRQRALALSACSPLVYLRTMFQHRANIDSDGPRPISSRGFPATHGVFLLITGNRRANIGSVVKYMEAGYRLLSGFTTPSRHTSAMSGNAKTDNIFVCELS